MRHIQTLGREEKHMNQKPALSPPFSNETLSVKERCWRHWPVSWPLGHQACTPYSVPPTLCPLTFLLRKALFSSLQAEQTLPIITGMFRSHLPGNNQLASEEGHAFCCCHTKLMTSFPHAEWRRPECHWVRCFCGVTTVGGQQDAQAAFRKHSHWLPFPLLFSSRRTESLLAMHHIFLPWKQESGVFVKPPVGENAILLALCCLWPVPEVLRDTASSTLPELHR